MKKEMSRSFTFTGRIRSFKYAIIGILAMLKSQHNAWVHAVATVVVCGLGLFFGFTASEWCWIILAIMSVWTAEALNTAFEFLADVASPEFHPLARKAKDVAAGAVLISAIGSVVIGLLIVGPHVLELINQPRNDRAMQMVVGGLLIFLARLVNVSMATVRTLLGIRGQKRLATTIGFFESLIYILAISRVLQDVGNVWNVLGYCGGFSAGTLVGLAIEEKLAMGYAIVRAISQSDGEEIASALRQAGYGVTKMTGEGLAGKVHIVTTVAKRRDIPAIMALVSEVDEAAFVTVDDANRVYRGHLGPA